MLGYGTLGQLPLGGRPFGTASITSISWFAPLSTPVRYRRDPKANVAVTNQFFAFNPSPLVSFAWFAGLSTPVRKKPFSPAASYPNFFYQPSPSPFVATGWYMPLSTPVRKKPGLTAALHPAFTTATGFIPGSATFLQGWYMPLSTPVRFKPGIAASRQQAYAAPARLLPTPNVTVTMSAFEVNTDEALIAVRVFPYNPPASAAVSIVEIGTDGSATSVWES